MKCVRFIVGSLLLLQVSCASIMKSEKTRVTFTGGLPNAETKVDLPDGQFITKNGMTTVLVSRSKEDIPITVTCNNQSMNGVIKTSFDPVSGVLGNLVFGGIIGLGIDLVGNKVYDPPSNYNLAPLCANREANQEMANTEASPEPLKNGKANRSSASE